MKQYQYDLPTGQIVLSPFDLGYALNEKNELDLTQVSKHDFSRLSILANSYLANIYQELSDKKTWITPDAALIEPNHPELSRAKNFCLIHKGQLYILNGPRYVPLNNMIETDDPDVLKIILKKVAYQTAICQASLAGQAANNTLSQK